MQAHDADLIGPKATGGDGRLLVADPHFGSDLMPTTASPGAVDDGGSDEVVPAPWMPAHTLLVGRHVFLSIHGLDQDFSGHLQDADFCLRARQRGFRCVYAGDVTAVGGTHDEAAAPIEMRRHFLERWSRFPELVFPAEAETLPQLARLG
jgi:GT2 family glycosyltransferase